LYFRLLQIRLQGAKRASGDLALASTRPPRSSRLLRTPVHTINGGPAAVVAEELLERVARHGHARDEEAFQSVTLSCLHRYLCAKSGAE
jgi:hypothetical protein